MSEFYAPYQRDILNVLMSIGVSMFLCMMAGFLYRYTHAAYSYGWSMMTALVGTGGIITMILMLVSNSIGLSVGAIATMSVVRYRNAMKDPRDLAYIFLAAGIGLACSSGNFMMAVECVSTLCGVVMLLHYMSFGKIDNPDYKLSFWVATPESVTAFQQAARAMFSQVALRSMSQLQPDVYEYTFLVSPGQRSVQETLGVLKASVPGISQISLIRAEMIDEL